MSSLALRGEAKLPTHPQRRLLLVVKSYNYVLTAGDLEFEPAENILCSAPTQVNARGLAEHTASITDVDISPDGC